MTCNNDRREPAEKKSKTGFEICLPKITKRTPFTLNNKTLSIGAGEGKTWIPTAVAEANLNAVGYRLEARAKTKISGDVLLLERLPYVGTYSDAKDEGLGVG